MHRMWSRGSRQSSIETGSESRSSVGTGTPVTRELSKLASSKVIQLPLSTILDTNQSVLTSSSDLLVVVYLIELSEKFKFGLDPTDFDTLATKFDISNNGKFCYSQFLKHFVLSMSPKLQDTANRRLLPASKAAVSGAKLTSLSPLRY